MDPMRMSVKSAAWRIAGFGALACAFYVVAGLEGFERRIFIPYMSANAIASGQVLRVLGFDASVSGTLIRIGSHAINVRRGCEALEPTVLLAAAMLVYPATWRERGNGFVVGALLLGALNVVRIVSLHVVLLRWPGAFEKLHLEIWPVAFVLAAVACWLRWAVSLDRFEHEHGQS